MLRVCKGGRAGDMPDPGSATAAATSSSSSHTTHPTPPSPAITSSTCSSSSSSPATFVSIHPGVVDTPPTRAHLLQDKPQLLHPFFNALFFPYCLKTKDMAAEDVLAVLVAPRAHVAGRWGGPADC
jgi:hypothetical protein